MRAWAVGAGLVLLLGLAVLWMFPDTSAPPRRVEERTFAAAGMALRVPSGWTGRASAFDPRLRSPVIEVRRGLIVRIEVAELGNTPGSGRFARRTLPIALRSRDVIGQPVRARRTLLGRLFATRERSFSIQAELPQAMLGRVLPEINEVLATLRIQPSPGMDARTLSRLERPLRLPRASGGRCPRSPTARVAPAAAYTLGPGPAFPVLTSAHGIAKLDPAELVDSWYMHKTLWAISPAYRGPLLVRGARIDQNGEVRFAGRVARQGSLRFPGRWPGETGWRYQPSATGVRSPGCYALQLDGLTFSRVVVFEARL